MKINNDEALSMEDLRGESLSVRKERAKELYFAYGSITGIATALRVKLPTMKSWVYGNGVKGRGWKIDRELAKNQLLKDLSKDKRAMVFNMVDGCLFLLYDFVDKTKKQAIEKGISIDIKTAERLTNILGNLSKIVEKENDSSDDANFTAPTSPKELQERVIKADPFSKALVVTEAVEVESEEVISSNDDIILDD